MEVAPPSNPGGAEQFMHKNRLQEYVQRSALPLPVYQTVNEGHPHAPQFRSTVTVDGVIFKSLQTFAHRKEAEQNVAKMALEGISERIKQEGCSLVHADSMFCKSILYEYAVKMNIDKPTYTCDSSEGLLPMFSSTVMLHGRAYKGVAGRNKKQAEQLAARTAIESVLGLIVWPPTIHLEKCTPRLNSKASTDEFATRTMILTGNHLTLVCNDFAGDSNSSARTLMSQIIKSKGKLYAAVHQVTASGISPGMNAPPSGGNIESLFGNASLDGRDLRAAATSETPVAVQVAACSAGQPSDQLSLGKRLKEESTFEVSSDTVGSQSQPLGGPPSQPVNACSQAVSDESHHAIPGQGKIETSSEGPSELANETEGTPSNRKRRRSNKGKKAGESKET